jgi:hypothetical protein
MVVEWSIRKDSLIAVIAVKQINYPIEKSIKVREVGFEPTNP